MHNLLILDDAKLNYIQEPFLTNFVKIYWNKIALVYPVMQSDMFFDTGYHEAINRGHLPDWLFAIVPDPAHPLDVDWIFLKPRQAHPWSYGYHPATDNFNSGGSITCLYETLRLIEALAEDDRVYGYCRPMPELYGENPPKSFEQLYSSSLFHSACLLSAVNRLSFEDAYAATSYLPDDGTRPEHQKPSQTVCLGLSGCSDKTLNMRWQVSSLLSSGSWVSTTVELADKVTLALRLAEKPDCHVKVSPRSAFGQWMEDEDAIPQLARDYREPLLIRINDDILLCIPQVSETYYSDAYFLDCHQQKLNRLGRNGGDPRPTLQAWNIHPQDARLRFLFEQ
ncbi:MAG: hypothetical protein KME07_05250 [Pegethrix bostrychoides GSE-TBD4-15B]|jgi:hypothetical protein|uniref:Uncharacterized protein n=1 Tax=Pegethrix bostrychoides GSE-TBD4-15B TaxID=2839662 RepID=A0A951U3N2_9CYAN|nr:hypothetical protein [Pegethrix bostrychoides GSE-TBD4-15B]